MRKFLIKVFLLNLVLCLCYAKHILDLSDNETKTKILQDRLRLKERNHDFIYSKYISFSKKKQIYLFKIC